MDTISAWSALQKSVIFGTQYGFVAIFQFMIISQRPDMANKESKVQVTPQERISDSYDFVIIGGGSAGSVLANRLTENKHWSALLLEAGKRQSLVSDVPFLAPMHQGTDMDWNFKSEPSSEYCLGMPDNQCNHARGKALGGCSMHNGMVYTRGNRKDYNNWRDLGNPGWAYDDVLPYFKKSLDMRIPDLQKSPYHNTGGYVTVEQFRYSPPLTEHFLEAGRDMGYNMIDVNGATQTGFTYSPGTLRDGLRCSTAKAFLETASHRKNLHVSTKSMVLKILVNETTKTAYGVEFHREGKTHIVYAKKEVILSAGVYQSPQILMLSGIGPKEHLKEVGIRVIHDSPGVGQNLQDHVAAAMTYLTDVPWECDKPTKADGECSATVARSGAEQFLKDRSGGLYGTPKDAAIAFVNSKYVNSTLDYPDLELGFDGTANSAGAGYCSKQYESEDDDFLASLSQSHAENFTFAVTAFLMHPKSRGYVKVKTANAYDPPAITPNFFNNHHDLKVLADGLRIAHELTQTPTMKKINARPDHSAAPECAHFPIPSDGFWECLIRYKTSTAFHPSCTCKMGPAEDAMAVVNPRLRVHGVNRLRVVDASIMPHIITGHTNAPTIMIAEKAADIIKEDHQFGGIQGELKVERSFCTKQNKAEKQVILRYFSTAYKLM